jgi:Trp operon repressor
MSHAKAIKTIQLLASVGDKSPKSLYADRLRRNIQGKGRRRTIDSAWKGLLIGILTTQQRSTGRSNLVRELLNSETLTWEIASNDSTSITRAVKGFNYNKRKRTYLRSARKWLLDNTEGVGEHRRALGRIPVDKVQERYDVEVEAADFVRKGVRGNRVMPRG